MAQFRGAIPQVESCANWIVAGLNQSVRTMPRLSVVVPMLNEGSAIGATLAALRTGAPNAEIIVVDGGSTDQSVYTARQLADRVVAASRGRARQMNAGATLGAGDILAFVHADTRVPSSFEKDILDTLGESEIVGGRFDVELDDPSLAYRLIGDLISLRSRITRTATGDQAIFVRRSVFEALGGFPDFDLCEDLDFSRRLKRAGKVACLHSRVVTSARRWRRDGLARTVLRMWAIRILYLLGVSPSKLKQIYADTR
jgi:rSAM/selenodomain-associated transferase 2